jgi:ribonuclease HII
MVELILGLDEAGRGPVIGPMVMAGCLIEKKHERYLKKIGVKDSKQITPKRREFLKDKILEVVENFEVIKIFPEQIDKKNLEGTKLNELEGENFSKIINKLNLGKEKIKVYIDCPSTSIQKWSDFLKTKIKNLKNLEIHCEHKADKNHVVVSAASILAKSQREKEIAKLKEIYGEKIGSGYCSDPLTKKFLEENAIKLKDKNLFRKTWITWKNAAKEKEQLTL